VKTHLYLICGALAAITTLHCNALVETVQPNSSAGAFASSSALLKTDGRTKAVVENCEDEWKANWEAMMKLDMTEDSYIEQCSAKDDVPAIPSEPKTNAAPSSAPK
jgi:hypothetical protein